MDFRSAITVADQVRAGRRTPREVIDACLDRIDQLDPEIGAFQLVDPAGARRAADALAARPDLADLPLAGVPVAVKDSIDVAGLPSRHGSAATSTEPAAADDELVRRLREAGAVVVGKTRLPELGIWGFTESIAHGGTRNPRDPGRNAGGSTGGGAAAVAAGMVALALGSDGGGSLRIPAAFCGVVGFKPAKGTVPLAGGLTEHWYGCGVNGPIATTVADAMLATDVLAGSIGWRESGDAPTPTPGTTPIPGTTTVALSVRSPSPIGPASRAARDAVRAAGLIAVHTGHQVVRADPPYPLLLANIWVARWLAGIAEEVERLDLPPEKLEPRTRSMVERGQRIRQRGGPAEAPATAWRDAVTRWFDKVGILISPVVARPAQPYGWGEQTSYLRAYANGARVTPFTQAWNVAGFPAISVPIGGSARQPGSVQLITVPGREKSLFTLATALTAASATN
jgi:amidase